MPRLLHSQLLNMAAFVHTVETGSFTLAATRLGVSKSVTGKSVARLEQRLGVKLLNRTTRSVSLTEEGRLYYQSCLRVMEELDQAESILAARQQVVTGVVRISLPISYGRLCVMPILTAVSARYPQLNLDISFTDRRVDLIEENVDLAIRLGATGDYATLAARQLATQQSVICAAPAYLQRRGVPVNLADLAAHDCLGFSKDGRVLPWKILDAHGNLKRVEPITRHIVSHGEALRDAAIGGMGIAYLSAWLAGDAIQQGQLQILAFATPESDAPITALWPVSRDLSPRIRVIVDALVNGLAIHSAAPTVLC